jgi:hypothetical protein
LSVDLAGLDTALGALGLGGRYEPAVLERYERGHGSDADTGTVGVVYEVVARRAGSSWRFVTVTRRYVG